MIKAPVFFFIRWKLHYTCTKNLQSLRLPSFLSSNPQNSTSVVHFRELSKFMFPQIVRFFGTHPDLPLEGNIRLFVPVSKFFDRFMRYF